MARSLGMSFVEYLVVLLLVVVGVFALVTWRPWDRWSVPTPPPAVQQNQGQPVAQVSQAPQTQAAPAEPPQPTAQQAPQGKGKVYLMALGAFPSSMLEELVDYYRTKHGIAIEVLPEIQMEREAFKEAFDSSRRQLVGEELIAIMMRQYPAQANEAEAILIGITRGDMYLRFRPDWHWAFAMRRDGRFAVVSIARMDPRNYGFRADPELLQVRLRKMISKQIGALYFRLPESQDKRSVMFSPILGVDDLDDIGEDF